MHTCTGNRNKGQAFLKSLELKQSQAQSQSQFQFRVAGQYDMTKILPTYLPLPNISAQLSSFSDLAHPRIRYFPSSDLQGISFCHPSNHLTAEDFPTTCSVCTSSCSIESRPASYAQHRPSRDNERLVNSKQQPLFKLWGLQDSTKLLLTEYLRQL